MRMRGGLRTRLGARSATVCGLLLLVTLAIPPRSLGTPPQFSSLSPDGGEFLVGGTTALVSWNVTHETDTRLYATITWGTGGSASSYFITAGVFPTGGASYGWPVPTWNTSDARVQVCVVAVDGSQGCRASAAPFAINATPPYVALLTPNDQASGVPLDTSIVIGFSDPADPSQISFSISPLPGAMVVTWVAGNTLLIIRSTGLLQACSTYVVTLSGSGPPRSWQFTTVCLIPPPIPPRIIRAQLTGFRAQDLELTWDASPDEGSPDGTVEYQVLLRTGIWEFQLATIAASGAASYTYVCQGGGHNPVSPYTNRVWIRAISRGLGFADSNHAATYKARVDAGWNLLSVPLEMSDGSIPVVLQTVTWDVARSYRQSDADDPWKAAYADRPGDLASLRLGDGLWVNMTAGGVFTVAGLVTANPTIALVPGWNLVGWASPSLKPWGESLRNVPGVIAVQAYSPSESRLVSLDPLTLLQPGAGYWILVAPGGGGDWVQG